MLSGTSLQGRGGLLTTKSKRIPVKPPDFIPKRPHHNIYMFYRPVLPVKHRFMGCCTVFTGFPVNL